MCNAPATVVDHIIPHRGDEALFNDRNNLQSLCTPCHSRYKQRSECRDA
ncbi:MAG: HNH endonuclease signature motif containing protein [Tateyamaria sp.]